LEFEGKKVNEAIRRTVLETKTNEFALFNNGITMMSDTTDLNERIGQRNKAQLTLTNPQIINGGQTAYTLSRLHEELSSEERDEAFTGKEVLLKIITMTEQEGRKASPEAKADLIARVSSATNQQTTVVNADRFSNDPIFIKIQEVLFRRYSLLFERKRGEFADGIHKGYAKADQIIERNLIFRLFLAVRGDIEGAVQKRLFMKFDAPERVIDDLEFLDRVAFSFWLYKGLFRQTSMKNKATERDRQMYARIYVLANREIPANVEDWDALSKQRISAFRTEWDAFVAGSALIKKNFWRNVVDPRSGETTTAFSAGRWMGSREFAKDVQLYFQVDAYALPTIPYVSKTNIESVLTLEEREINRLRKQNLIMLKESGTDLRLPRDEIQ
jgi:hypothetical protein